ncbi:hypothetical protein [Halomonas sp. KRD171]|uniref:hypothetical protein n=1 Tax=Halomonas sp. KRD171 TaxID=2729726 RepID=UPI0019D1816D|nr:hypothetical protein [Halomonas sp. KRD171]
MPLDPYQVSTPYLFTEPCEDVDYFEPITAFAEKRLEALAKRVIYGMQRMPASGMFEYTAKPLKSFWDEWCWYQAKYDNDCGSLSSAFELTLESMISVTVRELPNEEAVLISCAVCEDQQNMPARSDDEICNSVRDVVTEAAGSRSLARFEGW